MSAPELPEGFAAMLREMLVAERRIGHAVGRIEALREAMRLVLREIDRCCTDDPKDKRLKNTLDALRGSIGRLAVDSIEKVAPIEAPAK